jgi:hypothetical protein
MMPAYKNSQPVRGSIPSPEVVKKRYSEPAILTLKMESTFMREIDDEVLHQSNQVGHVLTRSDVVKTLITEALAARKKRRGK